MALSLLPRLSRNAKVASLINAVTAFFSVVVMVGWIAHRPEMVKLLPQFHPLAFNSALLFFLSGAAGIAFSFGHARVGQWVGVFMIALALGTMAQYQMDWQLGLDQLFVRAWVNVPGTPPGRMTMGACVNFLLNGGALLFLARREDARSPVVLAPGLFAAVTIAFSLVALLNYAVGYHLEYGWEGHSQLPLHGAFAFLLLGVAQLLNALDNADHKKFNHRWFMPFYYGSGLLIVTGMLWLAFIQMEVREINASTRNTASNQATLTAQEIDALIVSLNRMARRLEFNPAETEKTWAADAGNHLQDFDEVGTIGVLDAQYRTKWLRPRNPKNDALIGSKYATDQERENLLRRVVDTKQPVMSRVMPLKTSGHGFVLLFPVLKGEKINGMLAAGVRLTPFFSFLGKSKLHHVAVIEDGQTIFENGPGDPDLSRRWAVRMSVPSQKVAWTIQVSPTEAGLAAVQTSRPALVMIMGLIITLLVTVSARFGIQVWEKSRESTVLSDRLTTIMNVAPVGIFQSDPEGNCVYVNSFWCQLTGLGPEEALGSGWLAALHPEDKERAAQEWKEAILQQRAFSLFFRFLDRAGGVHWITANSRPLHHPDGSFAGLLGTVQDFTRQRLAEEEQRESRNFLQTVLDSLPVALFCKDVKSDFTLSLWNRKATELFGPTESEAVGKNDYDFFPKEEADFFRLMDERTLTEGMIVDIAEEKVTSASGERILHTIKVPIYGERGEPRFLLGISEDITQRKHAEKTIQEQRLQLMHAEKMTALGDMAGGMAHEINNPLTVLELCASRMKMMGEQAQIDPAKVKKNAEMISSTVERIATIIKGLRSFARDGGRDPFVSTPVRQIVSETLDFCQARFGNHQVHLRVHNIPDDLRLECRPTQVSQVLLNLLGNAFDAIHSTENPWIEVSAAEVDGCVELRVMDSGPGIPPEVAAKIMQPFFTTKSAGKGSGLGLSISQVIVTSHNGSLSIDSTCAHTCFVIRLPQRQLQEKKSA